jgi:hypothetical protein
MSIGLSILFTGLCALVGDGEARPGQVLLLDAPSIGEIQGVALPRHVPTLVVSLNDLANPEDSAPSRVVAGAPGGGGRVDQLGLWDLTGAEVRIRVPGGAGAGLHYFQPGKHQTSWPAPPRDSEDPAAWRDLRFVPHMAALVGDGRIDPSLVAAAGDGRPRALPRAVAARVHLDAGSIEAGIPSQASYRDDLFEFRGTGAKGALRQAMTDTIRWELEADARAIVIEIVPVDGRPPKQLLLAPSARPHRVFVSNLPGADAPETDEHHARMTDEQMIALHFGAYYALLMTPPADRPLPQLLAQLAARGAGGLRPKFCGAAVFSRR